MLTDEDVEALVAELPEVTVGAHYGRRTWFVGGKGFAWERPLTKADIRRYGDETPPDGPLLAVQVEDLSEKEAVLQSGRKGFFTIPHFDGYPGVLIQLQVASRRAVREALLDAWLACAPPALAEAHLAAKRSRR